MAVTVEQVEAIPDEYPDAPAGLSAKAAALDPAPLWQRIEAWTSVRWTAREVVWTVEGEGAWTVPLAPATVTSAEVWESGAWSSLTLTAGPYGFEMAGDGPYRITATVGGGDPDVPAAVLEAFRRLAEYSAEIGVYDLTHGRAGAAGVDTAIGGSLKIGFERTATWAARAMVNSGAADLLRPWRRAA
ncbi:hypothetical protein [Wenxinia marina]|uniref:Uncharacterized protein n=1 Tax=Wenxinia marina DSM 24838 TaxID=1123501 RepID=A0A0D0QIA3_9RHOB|nr:hypothetical protein [Wenxinia marina]KIQ70758.1 hypothetical protein Wenmar_00642 [Wenxinia marina DSM 24838]GGL80373.1 hypothetical protein GCM10011392_38720 [Wenxinia marina]